MQYRKHQITLHLKLCFDGSNAFPDVYTQNIQLLSETVHNSHHYLENEMALKKR